MSTPPFPWHSPRRRGDRRRAPSRGQAADRRASGAPALDPPPAGPTLWLAVACAGRRRPPPAPVPVSRVAAPAGAPDWARRDRGPPPPDRRLAAVPTRALPRGAAGVAPRPERRRARRRRTRVGLAQASPRRLGRRGAVGGPSRRRRAGGLGRCRALAVDGVPLGAAALLPWRRPLMGGRAPTRRRSDARAVGGWRRAWTGVRGRRAWVACTVRLLVAASGRDARSPRRAASPACRAESNTPPCAGGRPAGVRPDGISAVTPTDAPSGTRRVCRPGLSSGAPLNAPPPLLPGAARPTQAATTAVQGVEPRLGTRSTNGDRRLGGARRRAGAQQGKTACPRTPARAAADHRGARRLLRRRGRRRSPPPATRRRQTSQAHRQDTPAAPPPMATAAPTLSPATPKRSRGHASRATAPWAAAAAGG